MPYASTITIDDDINDYDIDKADDLIRNFSTVDILVTNLRCWLSREQFLQFVGDNYSWEEIERDDLHDDEDDDENDYDDEALRCTTN